MAGGHPLYFRGLAQGFSHRYGRKTALTLALSQRERGLKAKADARNDTDQSPLPPGEG